MKKENRGGARPGAGRSKLADKMQPFTIYIRESVIKQHTKDGIKKILLDAINRTV